MAQSDVPPSAPPRRGDRKRTVPDRTIAPDVKRKKGPAKKAAAPVKPKPKKEKPKVDLTKGVLIDDKDEFFEVEKIVGKRRFRNKDQYKVRWKNCPPSDDTWEPADNLCDTAYVMAVNYEPTETEMAALVATGPNSKKKKRAARKSVEGSAGKGGEEEEKQEEPSSALLKAANRSNYIVDSEEEGEPQPAVVVRDDIAPTAAVVVPAPAVVIAAPAAVVVPAAAAVVPEPSTDADGKPAAAVGVNATD